MTHYQVNVDARDVQEVLQRDDELAQLVSVVLSQILDARVTEQLQDGRYEQTEDRQGYRNGIRPQ
jgi:putative transposase